MIVSVVIKYAHVRCVLLSTKHQNAKGTRLCAQQKIVFKVYNYFAKSEQRGSTQGALMRTLEATG